MIKTCFIKYTLDFCAPEQILSNLPSLETPIQDAWCCTTGTQGCLPLFLEDAASLCLGDEPVKSQVRKLSTTHGFLCSFTLKGCRGKSEMFPMLAGNWLPNYLDVFLTLLSWWSTACGLFLLAWYQSGLKAVLSCAGHSHGHRLRASSIWPYVPSSAPVQNFFLRKEKEKTQCWLSVITSDHGRAATGSEEQVGSPKSMPHNVSVAICLMLFIFFRICQKREKCKCCIKMLICSINK